MRRRLDTELVRRGLVGSRSEAAAAIDAGAVLVGGSPAEKASTMVGPQEAVSLSRPARRFVSRGGEKLDAALERFEVDVEERECLDAGASTGGFTDCLLRRGAAHVVAVDVGYGQLSWALRNDERVTVLERINVRSLTPEVLPYRPELLVADLSFISLRTVLPSLAAVAADRAELVLLVKPQFEAGRGAVGRGGLVADPVAWSRALQAVAEKAHELNLVPTSAMASPLTGPAGNVEFFLHLASGPDVVPPQHGIDLEAVVREGTNLRAVR